MDKLGGFIVLGILGSVFGGLVSRSAAEDIDIQAIQKAYPQRQEQILKNIAKPESLPIEQAAALFFLGLEPDHVNYLLSAFTAKEASPILCALILRILNARPSKPGILTEQTIHHLETELAEWIRTQSLRITAPDLTVPLPENRSILEDSILRLWANHVDEATPDYQWPDKTDNGKHKILHEKEIHQWLDHRLRYGFIERSSPRLYQSMVALLNLRDWSQPSPLTIKAEAVIDLILADMVQESLQSQWGGIHCNDAESLSPQPCNRLQYLLFGWPEAVDMQSIDDSIVLHLCQSQFRPPSVFIRLAQEYSLRGTYEIKNCFYRKSKNPDDSDRLKKYGYVTPNFILSSFQLRDESVPSLSRPWDLMVLDENEIGHHLFSFTGTDLTSGGMSPPDQESYLWNSTVFQYKNVLFCRFARCNRRRPTTNNNEEFTDLRYAQLPTRTWIPNAFAPVTQEGSWWFSKMASVYIAFRPLSGRSYWWRTADRGTNGGEGTSILTFQDLFSPFLLEVETDSHFTSFDQFKNQVMNSPLEIDNDSITFVSRRGDVFLFPLDDGDFLVNGRKIDPSTDSTYQLFTSPFIHSDFGSGIIKAEWQGYSLLIDNSDPNNPKRIAEPN